MFMKFFQKINFINLIDAIFPACQQECNRMKLAQRFNQFDEEI